MNVRTLIVTHRGAKYNIDDRLYESEMYVPEIVRDKQIETHEEINGVIVIKTNGNKQYKQFLKQL